MPESTDGEARPTPRRDRDLGSVGKLVSGWATPAPAPLLALEPSSAAPGSPRRCLPRINAHFQAEAEGRHRLDTTKRCTVSLVLLGTPRSHDNLLSTTVVSHRKGHQVTDNKAGDGDPALGCRRGQVGPRLTHTPASPTRFSGTPPLRPGQHGGSRPRRPRTRKVCTPLQGLCRPPGAQAPSEAGRSSRGHLGRSLHRDSLVPPVSLPLGELQVTCGMRTGLDYGGAGCWTLWDLDPPLVISLLQMGPGPPTSMAGVRRRREGLTQDGTHGRVLHPGGRGAGPKGPDRAGASHTARRVLAHVPGGGGSWEAQGFACHTRFPERVPPKAAPGWCARLTQRSLSWQRVSRCEVTTASVSDSWDGKAATPESAPPAGPSLPLGTPQSPRSTPPCATPNPSPFCPAEVNWPDLCRGASGDDQLTGASRLPRSLGVKHGVPTHAPWPPSPSSGASGASAAAPPR